MGARGPAAKPAQLHVLRGDPSKLGAAKLASLLDEKLRPQVEIPEWPADLVPQLPALILPSGIQRDRAAGSVIGTEAKAEWDRITPHLAKLGLISQIDRAVVVMYCFWWAVGVVAKRKIIELGEESLCDTTPSGYRQMGVWLQVASKADAECKPLLAQIGLTPSSRTRIEPNEPQGQLPGMEKPQEGGWATFPAAPASNG